MAESMLFTMKNCKESENYNKENEKDSSLELSDNAKEKCNGRSCFYKKPIKKSNTRLMCDFTETPQEIRRQKLLANQKKNRNASFNAARGLFAEILNLENGEAMEEMEKIEKMEEMDEVKEVEEVVKEVDLEVSRESEEMDVEETEIKNKRRHRYPYYANRLMMSEWLLEVPQDLADKWIMVPCPVGKRVLVVAYKGSTKMYNKQGIFMYKFNSLLPGGSYRTNSRNVCTILDCIWIKGEKKCYVLDVIGWSSQEMVNCESEFRFFWIKSRMEEISELIEEKEGINDISFSFLPTMNCSEDFYPFLKNIPESFTIDGLLFYHKEAHYTENRTPLVTWLKTYMLPDALGITVPEPYDEKPSNYIDFQHHVQKVLHNEKMKIQNKYRKKGKTFPNQKTPEKEKVQENMSSVTQKNME